MLDISQPAADAAAPDLTTRDEFIATVDNEKVRRFMAELACPEAYDWSQLFPRTEGFGAAGEIKRRVLWLRSVEPRFETLLYPGERIEFVTRAVLNSFVEQYFMGIWAFIINRTLFLFTNYRVILINADGKGRAKTLMWQIPYGRLGKFKTSGLSGSMKFKLADGKALSFTKVPSRDRKRLKAYVAERVEHTRAEGFQFPSYVDRDNLCPTCATPVQPKQHACPECQEQFIKPAKAALMSFFLPGLGHLYLGHRGLALVELIGVAVLYALMGAAIASGKPETMAVWAVVILIANGFDAAITYHVARKGLLPTRRAWRG